LSAGPIEGLLVYHGNEFIDRIEKESERNTKLKHFLGGVWKNAMPDEIWKRVQKAADYKKW
jgi:hypothetical protein